MSLEDRLYPLLRLYEAAPQAVKTLAGRAYRSLPEPWRRGEAFAHFQELALATEGWDEETRTRYQVTEIRASLQAAARAPFYAKCFAERGLNPDRFESLEQLADYPLLAKTDLLEQREAMVNPDLPASARLYLTTGGSSGVPVGFYLHKHVSRAKEQAFLETQWRRRGWQPADRVAVIRGAVTSRRAQGSIRYYDATRDWLILSSYHLTADRAGSYLDELNRFRPRHLHAYPSAALMLARWMEDHGRRLDFQLTSILCGSEKLTLEDQALLERVFGARSLHWYGHSERVVLAAQGRESNHLYFWPSYGFVELGEPNAAGQREVIGTSFHNHVMPLVRYRTGDFVQLPVKPEGELPFVEVTAVSGRSHEFLISGSGRRISLTALNMHDDVFDGLYAVQFAQERPGHVEFRYQPGPRWQPHREDLIRKALLRKLGDDFALTVLCVPEVDKTPGGKARWLVTTLTL